MAFGSLTIITDMAIITPDELRNNARLGTNVADDELVSFINLGQEYILSLLKRTIMRNIRTDHMPYMDSQVFLSDNIKLPDVVTVKTSSNLLGGLLSIELVDKDDNQLLEITDSQYSIVDSPNALSEISFIEDIQYSNSSVKVIFLKVSYNVGFDPVPQTIKQAILVAATDAYYNRTATNPFNQNATLLSVQSLLQPYRII